MPNYRFCERKWVYVKLYFPVAGLGTRVLPATKFIPKVMFLSLTNRYCNITWEEAINAGIEEIIFVTSRATRCVEDHFDLFPDLEASLQLEGKYKKEEFRHLLQLASFASVRQSEPLGLGHAILCAKELIGNEPFAVILGDDLVNPMTPCLTHMFNIYRNIGGQFSH